MVNLFLNSTDYCNDLIQNYMKLIFVVVFLISYMIFNKLLKTKTSEQEKLNKSYNAEKYLKEHLSTDQEFFLN